MKEEEKGVHWSQHKEKSAGYWHLKFLLILFKIFPVVFLKILAFPVGFFYFIFSKKSRNESKRFLIKAASYTQDPKNAKKCRSFFGPLRHIISFSLTLIEKIQGWSGKFSFNDLHFHDDDSKELINELENGKGAFLFISHLGNAELLRGLANFNKTGVSRKIPLTVIADKKVSKNFSRMLKELNPDSDQDIFCAQDIGADSVVLFEEKLSKGEIITIAGDRTSPSESEKNIMLPFLGEDAPFSLGAFYLSALLNSPVFFIFALRRGDLSLKPVYDMHVHKANLTFDCTKKERLVLSSSLAKYYAELLETHCKKMPFQWYNFFDFWSKGV